MNDTLPFALESNQVRLPVTLAAPAGSPSRRYTPAALRSRHRGLAGAHILPQGA